MKDYSQHGESTVLANLFEQLNIYTGVFVDIGAGDGYHLSNTRYFLNAGWKGVMIDADNKGNMEVHQAFVNLDNVLSLLRGVPEEFDLLSIDIDGNDFWILQKIITSAFKPKVIICEVNSQLPLYKSIAMSYDENYCWDGSHCYGMSYLAACKLLHENGYTIYDVVHNTNIIAVQQEYRFSPKLYSFGLTFSHPEINTNFITI